MFARVRICLCDVLYRHVSTDMHDFVVADDIFWKRTCSEAVRLKYAKRKRPLPPTPTAIPEVHFADDDTVARILTEVPTAQGMRRLRLEAMRCITAKGIMRPIARLVSNATTR